MKHLRSTVVIFALTLAAPVAAFAQPGGLPSATAPSNSEGTPSGGTGIVGSSRVVPSTAGEPIVLNNNRRHRTHRRYHRHHHTAAKTSGQ